MLLCFREEFAPSHRAAQYLGQLERELNEELQRNQLAF